jgi:hypothetical protein
MAWAVTEKLEPRAATAAADTRCLAISTATVAGAGARKDLFNEGNLVDFAKRRGALQDLLHRRFPKESHAFFLGLFLDFR